MGRHILIPCIGEKQSYFTGETSGIQKCFTPNVIVVIGILRECNYQVLIRRNASDGVAKRGICTLRSRNTLIYSQCGPMLLSVESLVAPEHSQHGKQ